jgi:hypothetical protein
MKRKNSPKKKKNLHQKVKARKRIPDVKVEIETKIIGYDMQGGTGPIYKPRYSMEDGSCQRGVGSIGMPW